MGRKAPITGSPPVSHGHLCQEGLRPSTHRREPLATPFLDNRKAASATKTDVRTRLPGEESNCGTTPPYQLLGPMTGRGAGTSPRTLACQASVDQEMRAPRPTPGWK